VFAPVRGANDGRTFQFGAWEVEKTTMDVHTGEISYQPDPSVTAAVPASGSAGQGRLFDDPRGDSFANTDQLPAVGGARRPSNPYGAPRWLRVLVVLVVIGILAAGAALALVKTGVIGKSSNPPSSAHTANTTNTSTPPTTVSHTSTLLTPAQTFGGAGAGNYTIAARAFLVTVTAGPGRSWVSIGIVGQSPVYAGILQPNTSKSEILLGPAQVSIGAGGTTMTVTSGHKSQTLTPPSAPFTFQITPAG
jgi:hypothetical protein